MLVAGVEADGNDLEAEAERQAMAQDTTAARPEIGSIPNSNEPDSSARLLRYIVNPCLPRFYAAPRAEAMADWRIPVIRDRRRSRSLL